MFGFTGRFVPPERSATFTTGDNALTSDIQVFPPFSSGSARSRGPKLIEAPHDSGVFGVLSAAIMPLYIAVKSAFIRFEEARIWRQPDEPIDDSLTARDAFGVQDHI